MSMMSLHLTGTFRAWLDPSHLFLLLSLLLPLAGFSMVDHQEPRFLLPLLPCLLLLVSKQARPAPLSMFLRANLTIHFTGPVLFISKTLTNSYLAAGLTFGCSI